MATKIPKLSVFRRFNWAIANRNYRIVRKAWLSVVAILLAFLLIQGESFMRTRLQLLTVQNAYFDLQADVYRLANFGAPGWVHGTGEELDREIALNTKGNMR